LQPAELPALIARQRPGWSLERPFYTAPEIYEFERRGWLSEQWYILGHGSEARELGSYIVRDLLGESLIIVRDTEGVLRGFYNVCRHRGTRICDKDGRAAAIVCPYHSWTYRLDGSLRTAAALPESIDTAGLGLRPVPIREIGGIIFGSLTADPQSLDPVQQELTPMLHYHGIPEARIGARRSYPTRGNWKLVIENFIECYHCFPCHPEFCTVMKFVDVAARQATPENVAAWQQTVERWFSEKADPDSPVKRMQLHPLAETGTFLMSRAPIGGNHQTDSQDGLPVAPLMGQLRRFDGGSTGFRLEPFVWFSCLNDHARMMQFLPTGTDTTDVVVSWLVDGSARETDVDVERMIWLWDVTTAQDKLIIERNATGVRSHSYIPGPYSTLECWTTRFVSRYLRELSAHSQS